MWLLINNILYMDNNVIMFWISRCDISANSCSNLPHNWRNLGLLYVFGPYSRSCNKAIPWSMIEFVFRKKHTHKFLSISNSLSSQIIFVFKGNWPTSHATLLGFGIPIMSLWLQKYIRDSAIIWKYDSCSDPLCMYIDF